MGKHSEEKTKKKRKFWKTIGIIFLIILTILVILAGSALGYIYSKLGKMNVEEIDETAIGITEETQERLSGYRNIALLGIDSRADDYGKGNRSDCIIIASLNQKTKDIKLISVYRDTLKNPLETILLFIVSTLSSIIFIYLTSKIKVIKEKVFLIKG